MDIDLSKRFYKKTSQNDIMCILKECLRNLGIEDHNQCKFLLITLSVKTAQFASIRIRDQIIQLANHTDISRHIDNSEFYKKQDLCIQYIILHLNRFYNRLDNPCISFQSHPQNCQFHSGPHNLTQIKLYSHHIWYKTLDPINTLNTFRDRTLYRYFYLKSIPDCITNNSRSHPDIKSNSSGIICSCLFHLNNSRQDIHCQGCSSQAHYYK